MEKREVIATVTSIIPKGRYGPYAVTRSDSREGSITVSLKENCWEGDLPVKGDSVILSKLRKRKGGWRALKGRLESLPLANSKQQGADRDD